MLSQGWKYGWKSVMVFMVKGRVKVGGLEPNQSFPSKWAVEDDSGRSFRPMSLRPRYDTFGFRKYIFSKPSRYLTVYFQLFWPSTLDLRLKSWVDSPSKYLKSIRQQYLYKPILVVYAPSWLRFNQVRFFSKSEFDWWIYATAYLWRWKTFNRWTN